MDKSRNMQELRKLDGKPSWGAAFPQAFQHILAMLAGNITPPIIIATNLALSEEKKIILIQAAMLIGGITTLVQILAPLGFGMGLPNAMGVAFAYMPILLLIGKEWGIGAIFGAQIVAAFLSIFMGMAMEKIAHLFPPVVSGTVVLCIGLSLYTTAMDYIAGGSAAKAIDMYGAPKYLAIAGIVLIITLICNFFGKGMLKTLGLLVGMIAGYIIWAFFIGVDTKGITEASWVALPKIFYFKPVFKIEAIVIMILMYIVQAVQTIGDVSSTAVGAFNRPATHKELGGAVKGTGICGMLGGVIGGFPTDPFSQNVGIIVTTKVVAKRVFVILGGMLVLAGLLPKFGGIMTSIPAPVLGGATITVFAAITMSGVQLITEQPLNYRNKLVVGISLAIAVGFYVKPEVLGALNFIPEQIISVLTGSPIIVGFLVSFILNLLVPKDESQPIDD
ncbi:uracil-xanthine permease family protein [Miniphocaeibacter massiliensis]|uniref:uracil-xanthine permease family protein n=1 Tax=Miniphocaeibacter massiliensis TaxID=2041841 RepID=UPI000C1C09A6|nr:solute carrier family 23 protein [Miniphocaeibacter massiliensis]